MSSEAAGLMNLYSLFNRCVEMFQNWSVNVEFVNNSTHLGCITEIKTTPMRSLSLFFGPQQLCPSD